MSAPPSSDASGAAPPHHSSRPVHWVVTTVAVAAVLGASALVRPSAATAGPPRPSDGDPAASRPMGAPDPGKAHFPVKCGRAGADVLEEGSADLDGDGRPETVAVVRCHSGMGTPPSGIYVLAQGTGDDGEPRVVETLLDPGEGINVGEFAVGGRTVSATLLGYSSPDVPRCCPDRKRRVKWQWSDGKFVLTALPVPGSV
ncbi:hypothetical protein M1E25_06590 [Streptomyces sp. MTZ3.1]|uniref:Secreted protein n=1 Tax=Streptomyces meridianus TaxID=2938945 RepID=A0ABT0X537_9ACTN|nr:hypothetical protein [Streptomyces meridianus]